MISLEFSLTPTWPRGILCMPDPRAHLGVKVGLSKFGLFSFKDNPMLRCQSYQVELPTAVFSHIHYNLSGYLIKLMDARIWLIWQRDDRSRKFLRVIFDLCNSLYPLFSWCVVHEAPVSLLQFMIRHHRIDSRTLDRRVAEDVHHIGA